MKTIMHIVGTRPNYVKASPVINSIVDYKQVVLNTGQHYDDCLSKNIIDSLDMRKPDINLVDKISSLHFVTEESGINNLNSEGFSDSIHLVGNTMIDSLIKVIHSEKYRKLNINNTNNILLTCHRPSNVDNKNSLQKIFDMCYKIERKITWPLHPRTKNRMIEHNLLTRFESLQNLDLINPLEYCKFLKYMATSYAVITDSGGIQEETTYLKVPCLTIRKNTERPITITTGTNRLVSIKQVTNSFEKLVEDTKGSRVPIMWDGYAAQRISKVISNFMEI